MSLEQLTKISVSASNHEKTSSRHEAAAKALADMRKGPRLLKSALIEVFDRWRYGSDEVARDALYFVINEMAADIYRIAEMRLAAEARFYKVSAAQKRAIITSSILPLPDMDQDQEQTL